MQAIQTRLILPTAKDTNQYIKASCDARTHVVLWLDNVCMEGNHLNAAKELCALLGWKYTAITSGSFGGDFYHTLKWRY